MGNKIFVDKFPNSIESIIKHTNIKEEEISKLIDHNKILLSSYQKLNFWSLSENQNKNKIKIQIKKFYFQIQSIFQIFQQKKY